MDGKKNNSEINSQLELFTKINSSLDDVGNGVNGDDENIDPRDDPFNPAYRSKVVCPIDDKYHRLRRR